SHLLFLLLLPPPPLSTPFPYTTLFRSQDRRRARRAHRLPVRRTSRGAHPGEPAAGVPGRVVRRQLRALGRPGGGALPGQDPGGRSEEHTSELQSRGHLVCRLLLEKKKK